MAKHIILAKLFEFGGSNTHLKTLINYFGEENVILILEGHDQLPYLKKLNCKQEITVKIRPKLHSYAHLRYRFTTNLKELFKIIASILSIQILSIKSGFADITISSVEPEKYLYLLWMPVSNVKYILHTTPIEPYTPFTSYTCNNMLGTHKKIVTVSFSNQALIYRHWNIADSKQRFVNVVHNCIDEPPPRTPDTPTVKNQYEYVVTLGHAINYKNPYTWLDVARQVTELRTDCVFIWFGDGPLLEELKAKTTNTPRIIFKGMVQDAGPYLDDATIYYQPSLYETHGIAVLEAMYHGLPCVVSDVGGLPESVQHQYNGLLVQPTDVPGHVRAIISLLDNSSMTSQYGSNGYEKYQEKFSYVHFKAAMDVIYNEIGGRKNRSWN